MRRIVFYISFVAAGIADAAIFVTTTSYVQLLLAIFLYLPLAYFAFKLFPRKTHSESTGTQTVQPPTQPVQRQGSLNNIPSIQSESDDVEIYDINKRVFLKLIGATGLSFFISSLFTRRFGTLLGRAEEPGMTKIQDPAGNLIEPAKQYPTDNYKISEVDYGFNTYYGFIDQGEGWFIMKEDANAGTYRYTKGDTNFLDNWDNRENLRYDLFNRVFPKS